MVSPARTIILGGGLAGLSCARSLGGGFLLLEAEDHLGGLCRTDTVDGFSFDWTGHWLHARDPAVRRLISERWLRDNLLTVERKALVFSEGTWTAFPYQNHLYGLPPATIAACLAGFVEAHHGESGRALRERPLSNAGEFIARHLGQGFAEKFLVPYNEKLFCVPIDALSPEWGGRFIPRPSFSEVLQGALFPAHGGGYNSTFWYPRDGGIEALVRGLVADVAALPGQVRTCARAAALELASRTLTLASGETLPFKALVTSVPLSALARALVDLPAAVAQAAARLRAVSVTVVELGVRDKGGQRFHWAYFPEPRFPFYRVGSPSEVNPRLAPAGTRSFAVEFSHLGPLEPAGAERLIAQAIEGLEACGLLQPAQVLVARTRTIEHAYVLFDHAHQAARATVLAHLAAHQVHVAGRYGRWEYSSMEDALLSGMSTAEAVQAAEGAP